MKFSIERGSWRYKTGITESPCLNAVEVSREVKWQPDNYQGESLRTPQDTWLASGFNHRIEEKDFGRGAVRIPVRDYYQVSWEIEINSLSELLALMNEVGQLVIDEGSIVIYDSHLD